MAFGCRDAPHCPPELRALWLWLREPRAGRPGPPATGRPSPSSPEGGDSGLARLSPAWREEPLAPPWPQEALLLEDHSGLPARAFSR